MLQALSLLYMFSSYKKKLLCWELSDAKSVGSGHIRSAIPLCEYIQKIFYSITKIFAHLSRSFAPFYSYTFMFFLKQYQQPKPQKNNPTKWGVKHKSTYNLRQALLPCLPFLAKYKEGNILFNLHSNYCITQRQWINTSMFD